MSFTIIFAGVMLAAQGIAAPISGEAPRKLEVRGEDYDLNGLSLLPDYQLDPDLQNVTRCGPNYCARTNSTGDNWYVCGDKRLGPVILPNCPALSDIVGQTETWTYHRFGGLCPGEFLAKWTNDTPDPEIDWFFYPYADGFANNTAGDPIRGNLTLTPGMLVDRFGSTSGSFVSPASSPYAQRALPPANLDFGVTNGTQIPYNYHVYEVRKPVVVTAGPVAPWFGQPGFGTQFELPASVKQLLEDEVFAVVEE